MYNRKAAVVIFIFTLAAWTQPVYSIQPGENPKLESVLSQLISANNTGEFAKAHDIYMQDGNIRVVVEMTNETAALPDYVVEETRYKNKVQVLVPIDKMSALSLETNVTFIRAALRPYADTPAMNEPTPKSGFDAVIPFILSIALVFLIRKRRSGSDGK